MNSMVEIQVKRALFEEIVEVNAKIPEFDNYDKNHFP